MDKIKFLCMKSPKDEWSAILFYRTTGTILEADSLELIVEDLLLMDINSPSYTSFNWGSDYVQYMMQHDLDDHLVGHIHSHNVMDVFFSGTDMSELNDNCPNFNYYLSLIVNNIGQMTAKIAIAACPVSATYKHKNEHGVDVELITDEVASEEVDTMLVYKCDVITPTALAVPEAFKTRFDSIKAKPRAYAASGTPVGQNYTGGYSYPITKGATVANPAITGNKSGWEKEDKETEILSIEEQFFCYVLRLGKELVTDEVEVVVADLLGADLNMESIGAYIETNLGTMYDEYFKGNAVYAAEDKYFEIMNELKVIITNQSTKDAKELDPIFEAIDESITAYKEYLAESSEEATEKEKGGVI